jgi:hypothetical protein
MMATHIEFDEWHRKIEQPVNTKVPKTRNEQEKVENLKKQFDELFAN